MPKWGWWLAAVLVFVIWNFDSIGDYWFGGWWTTVSRKSLGDWHAADLIPFIAIYFAIRSISETIASFRAAQQEQAPRKRSEAQAE